MEGVLQQVKIHNVKHQYWGDVLNAYILKHISWIIIMFALEISQIAKFLIYKTDIVHNVIQTILYGMDNV
jgi:hypothetical protein